MISTIFTWWVWLEILSIIAIPFAFVLFKNLPDRGYPLAKVLGILWPSYLLWLGSSLHVVANRRWSIFFILFLLLVGAVLLVRQQWQNMRAYLRSNLLLIVTTEVIFLAGIVFWSIVHSYAPSIQLQDHPMNFAFINSIMRSDYMPPIDPWLSGFPINYYYFGHFINATAIKLSGLPTNIAYNLIPGSIFGLAAMGIFSLVFNLAGGHAETRRASRKAVFAGSSAVVLLLVVGNLEGLLEFMYAHNVGSVEFWHWISIKDLTAPYASDHWYPTEPSWWRRSVLVLDTLTPQGGSLDLTYNEYPFSSLISQFAHAYMTVLPLSLLALSFALNLFFVPVSVGWNWLKGNVIFFVGLVVSFGSLAVTNTWDLPTYSLLLVAVILVHNYMGRDQTKRFPWLDTAIVSAIALIGMFLFFLPYYNYYLPYGKILPWLGPSSRPLHLFLIFGLFASVIIAYLPAYAMPFPRKMSWKILGAAALPLAVPVLLWIFLSQKGPTPTTMPFIEAKILGMWPLLVLFLVVLILFFTKLRESRGVPDANRSAIFVSICTVIAFYLIFGVEFFHFKDGVEGWGRTNTVAKSQIHTWVLMALSASYGLYYLLFRWKPASLWSKVWRNSWLSFVGLLLGGSLLFSTAATLGATNFFHGEPTLDGLSFLSSAEREYIDWLNNNVSGNPVIAEASDVWSLEESRVSVRTGLPTVLGWEAYEIQWRGPDNRDYRDRVKQLEMIYQSDDQSKVQSLLSRHKVEYIVVGWLETQKYGPGITQRFDGWFERAFSNSAATIYKTSPVLLSPARNPRAQITGISYREPATGAFRPLGDNDILPADVYHFNGSAKNFGNEKVTIYYEVTQSDGTKLVEWGAPEWDLSPGQEIALFMQGANLKPPGRIVQITFALKEKGSNRVLDQKTLTVRSQ